MRPDNTYSATSEMDDEPGAQENRLSINPNDPRWVETVGQWENGKEYIFSTVTVRQVSPGEFEVLEAQVSDEAEPSAEQEAGENKGDSQAGADESMGEAYPNPAVQRMMSGPKR